MIRHEMCLMKCDRVGDVNLKTVELTWVEVVFKSPQRI